MDFDLMREDAWNRLDAVARVLIDDSAEADFGEELFHYTSVEGLVGIGGSSSLWASDMLSLSDASEVSYAHKLIQEVLDASDGQLLPPEHRGAFEESLHSTHGMYTPFVACFCEDGDQLGQWRAFGSGGEGFALGFRSSWLASSAIVDDARFSLVKVTYSPDQQQRLITQFFRKAASVSALYPYSDADEERWFWGIAANAIPHLVVAIKNPVFKEEKEWRLVNTSIITPDENYSYRVSGDREVSFVKIPIDANAITSFVRGPLAGGRGLDDILRYSVFSMGAKVVRNSKIPLRR